jgi:hypothetical protein
MADITQQTDWKSYPEYEENGFIVLKLIPRDLTCAFELQRAAGTGAFETIIIYPPSQMRASGIIYADPIPIDGTTYQYRGRHTSEDPRDSGVWSTPVYAKAGLARRQFQEEDVPLSINLADPTNQDAEFINVTGLGADGDVILLEGISTTSGSITAISPDNPFEFTDISKLIEIRGAGAGGTVFVTTIVEVLDSGSVLLGDAPPTTVNDQPFRYGTNSTEAIQIALNLAQESSKPSKIKIPAGTYFVSSSAAGAGSLKVPSSVAVVGDGPITELLLLGPHSGPILQGSSSLVDKVVISDLVLNGDKEFHDSPVGSGSAGFDFENLSNFAIRDILLVSCSNDAGTITSGNIGSLQRVVGRANSANDIVVNTADALSMLGVNTAESIGFGVVWNDVVSSSIETGLLAEDGSGSLNIAGGGRNVRDIEYTGSIEASELTWYNTNPFAAKNDQLDTFYAGTTRIRGYDDMTMACYSGSLRAVQYPFIINDEITGSLLAGPGFPLYVGGGFSTVVNLIERLNSDGNTYEIRAANETPFNSVDPASQNVLWSISLLSGSVKWAGPGPHIITGSVSILGAISASEGLDSSSGLTGSFSGTFDGEYQGKIASGTRAYHELVDVGAQSSSFTMSFENGNFKRFEPGANISIAFFGLSQGQVSVLEIDNSGNHTVTLPGNLVWHAGVADSVSSGSNVLTLTELTIGTLAVIAAKDVQ